MNLCHTDVAAGLCGSCYSGCQAKVEEYRLISSGGDAGLSMYSVVATKSALGCRSRRDSASSSGERPRHSS